MPENALYVGRPTRWGNPFTIGNRYAVPLWTGQRDIQVRNRRDSFRVYVATFKTYGFCWDKRLDIRELQGKNLACWCKLCKKHQNGKPYDEECRDCDPCHADILLEWAN
jgi:hypothetical protein